MIQALHTVEVVTLFVEDLEATKAFYQSVFSGEVVYEDQVSWVLKLNNIMINLLQIKQAGILVMPRTVAAAHVGSRLMFTLNVENTDDVCKELARLGIDLLNGPIDRPWGRRTAAFADPAGNVWEVAQEL